VSVLPKPIAVTKTTVLLSRKDWKAVVEALEDAEDRGAVRASMARRAVGKDDEIARALGVGLDELAPESRAKTGLKRILQAT